MNDLIKIESKVIGNENVNSVDARELWTFLESKQEFATWIKNRLEKYGFTQGIDFIKFDNFIMQVSGTKARIDYALTVDTAKELSMVENNPKGKQARKYFIECEKKLRHIIDPIAKIPETVQCQLMGAEVVARMLNYSEASKIDIVQKVYSENNIPSGFLPAYVENVKIVLSATELLKRNNCELKIRAFNTLLVNHGYLENRTRPSSKKDVTRKFKALTDKGKEFGQNDVSPKNKLEVQSHFFEDTFMELYGIVTE